MTKLDHGTAYIDANYLGHAQLIATGILETDEGLLLVDPGPTTVLPNLEAKLKSEGASWEDVHGLLLTHIHLDHAGATGSIVDKNLAIQVYVHVRGARHLIRPERLLSSAQRLYGDLMEPLWGDFLPVPEANVHALEGTEILQFGPRKLDVAYTPGHAVHHVSFLDHSSGIAFIGDTAGLRVTGADHIIPVAPPPDIAVEAWRESLDRIRAWKPKQLFLTHFGPANDVNIHLDRMEQQLVDWAEAVRISLSTDQTDEERAQQFDTEKMAQTKSLVSERYRTTYERFGSPRVSWYGLARYWRKKR